MASIAEPAIFATPTNNLRKELRATPLMQPAKRMMVAMAMIQMNWGNWRSVNVMRIFFSLWSVGFPHSVVALAMHPMVANCATLRPVPMKRVD